MDSKRDILEINDNRLSLPCPSQYQIFDDNLKQQRKCFWVPDEIIISQTEIKEYNKMGSIKSIIKKFLSFFAIADDVVMEYLENIYINSIQIREIKSVYKFQNIIEDIHSVTYMKLFTSYISDPRTRINY